MRCAFELLESRRLCAAGDQDLSYGANGFLRLRFGDAAYQFLPGSDPAASATVVGLSADGASFTVRRFNAGVPDETAGPGGTIATIPLPFDVPAGKRAAPARVWNLSGGRTLVEFIVPVRSNPADGFYLRLNADRTLDTTYGDGGVVMVRGGFWLDVVQQGDKLVALRDAGELRPTVARFTDELELDTTFGDNGVIIPGDRPQEIAIQPDGKIVLATWESALVFRLTADGRFDPTFDGDGIAETGNLQLAIAVAVDDAGRIVVSGDRSIRRLTSAGSPDTTFGTNGTLVPFPATDNFNMDVVLPDGTLLHGATQDDVAYVMRITPGGQYDSSFGRAFVNLGMFEPRGDRTVELILDPQASSPQPDGSVLVSRRFADGRFVQVRLEAGGTAPGVVALSGGVMTVTGSDDDDFIVLNPAGGIVGTRQGIGRRFEPAEVTSYHVDARAGDDTVVVGQVTVVVDQVEQTLPAVVFGGLGDDRIAGSRGDDTIFGNAGNDRIEGYGGNDLLHGNGGRDKLSGGPAPASLLRPTDGNDRLFGGVGGDWLAGGSGEDILDGGLGDDHLDGGTGADRIMGNDGNDVFVSDNDNGAVDDLYGGGGADTLLSGDEDDLLTDIETT